MSVATLSPETAEDLPAVNVDSILEEASVAAEREYRTLGVFPLANGQSVSPLDLRDRLLAADRSHADLRKHVAVAQDRRQAITDLASAEALSKEAIELAPVVELQRAEID